jgi:hypothetical protein
MIIFTGYGKVYGKRFSEYALSKKPFYKIVTDSFLAEDLLAFSKEAVRN